MLTKSQKYQVHKLRAEYFGNISDLRELWELDAKVKSPAKKAAWVCGILGILLVGLSIIIGEPSTGYRISGSGIFYTVGTTYTFAFEFPFMVCVLISYMLDFLGPVLLMAVYPVYRLILNARKKKYAFEILKLTNELLNN